jgi:hypothetical protein
MGERFGRRSESVDGAVARLEGYGRQEGKGKRETGGRGLSIGEYR